MLPIAIADIDLATGVEGSCRCTRRRAMRALLGAWGGIAWAGQGTVGFAQPGDEVRATLARWPHWRGPAADGQMPQWPAPLVWGASHGVAWRADVPPGTSTPVVWDRGIYLTAQQGSQLQLLRLDLISGKPRWQQTLGTAPPWPKQLKAPDGWPWPLANWAAPSPVTDGEVVVALFADGLLSVHRVEDGKRRWFRRLGRQDRSPWPSPASPLLWRDRVIVLRWTRSAGQTPQAQLAAYDKLTGRQLWQVRLSGEEGRESALQGASPAWGTLARRPVLAVAGAGRVHVIDPDSGQELLDYRLGAAQPCVTSPLVAEQLVVACRGSAGPMLALEHYPGRRGVRLRRVWQRQIASPALASAARWRDLLFLVSQRGQARCIHLPTGKSYWHRRLQGTFYASPVTAEGRVYFLSYEGTCYVAAASGNYRLLARNRLPDRFIASPAVAAAHLFLRGEKRLYCVGPYLDQNR